VQLTEQADIAPAGRAQKESRRTSASKWPATPRYSGFKRWNHRRKG
jgi:hypothetical protein